jgi:hypothetical protein
MIEDRSRRERRDTPPPIDRVLLFIRVLLIYCSDLSSITFSFTVAAYRSVFVADDEDEWVEVFTFMRVHIILLITCNELLKCSGNSEWI